MYPLQIANVILIIAWVASIIYAQHAQAYKYHWETAPLSHYLVDGPVIDWGFVCLAAALACYAVVAWGWATPFYALGAVGALLVVATKTVYSGHKRLHNISAGLAYGGAGVGNILASLGHPFLLGFAVVAPVVVGALVLMRVSTAAQERIVAIVMIAWFGCAFFLL